MNPVEVPVFLRYRSQITARLGFLNLSGARLFALPFLVALVAFELMRFMQHGHDTGTNNYVLLADAWLHGRSWIAYPGERVDAVPFHGHAYIVEGPSPALLLMPLVALYGMDASQPLVANVLGAVAVFTMWRFAERCGLSVLATFAVTAFTFFATSLFTCASLGDVWFLAHVVAFTFTLLAITECFGSGRPWLIAIYALIAAFARFPLVTAMPLYAIALWLRDRSSRDVLRFVAALVPGFILSAWYDLVRWGTIGDPGFSIWYKVMDDRALIGTPMFSIANLPMQLSTFVDGHFRLAASYPFVLIGDHGASILWLSFPFVYALAAPLSPRTILLWIGAIATAIPAFTYYDTGQYQFGMRHALDFEPFLCALLVFALARRPSKFATYALMAFALFDLYEGIVWLRPAS